jgi:uncharacterized lipoprotein YmbA
MRGLIIVTLVMLAGCGLDRPNPGKSFYVLDGDEPGPAPSSGVATRVIRVSRATLAPPFSSRALQYRVAANRYEPSYYHNWADDPGEIVAAAASEMIAASGAFVVLAPGTDATGCETLAIHVTTFSVDVTGPMPVVVLALRATLLDDTGAIRLAREFERTEPAASADAPDAVRALDTALQAMLRELTGEIIGNVG